MGYSKAEYIRRFGEDYYYNVVKPANRARNAKYIKSEKGTATRKKYAQSEKSKNYRHRYYIENKNAKINKVQEWLENHREERREYQKNYMRDRRQTKKGRAASLLSTYNSRDKEKNLPADQNIDAKWIIENIFTSKCIYCGDDDWKHLGADRIDNSKPHTPDNVVCACGICNIERSDKYTVEEFKEYRQTHPIVLGADNKSWEIVEMEGIKVIKKKQI